MAEKVGMDPLKYVATIKATCFSSRATDEEFAAFMLVANKYELDPITKEIYAFPKKGGGIQPIVSIDGWIHLANSHPALDGIEFEDIIDEGRLVAIKCRIHRKDRTYPTEAVEYMDECKRGTEPWKQWPIRMLRHKALIQAARIAFGFSGFVDPDEADRMLDLQPAKPHAKQISVSKLNPPALTGKPAIEVVSKPAPEPDPVAVECEREPGDEPEYSPDGQLFDTNDNAGA
jgi:phage recombination protein Bet